MEMASDPVPAPTPTRTRTPIPPPSQISEITLTPLSGLRQNAACALDTEAQLSHLTLLSHLTTLRVGFQLLPVHLEQVRRGRKCETRNERCGGEGRGISSWIRVGQRRCFLTLMPHQLLPVHLEQVREGHKCGTRRVGRALCSRSHNHFQLHAF